MVVEVAAAIIQRADAAFLLARRPPGRVYAGYWEFPGGKAEPGESMSDTLSRELDEELGISVLDAYPWIRRVFSYPHGTVRLHFFRVVRWRGEPRPREDQAIAWQRLGQPMVAPILPANAPVLAALSLPHEYAITRAAEIGVPEMLACVRSRLENGLKLLHVREPEMDAELRERFTGQVLSLARRYGARVLVKPPIGSADGVHLTAAQLMTLESRPREGLVAASCHCAEELSRAMQLELDFAVLGPVQPTPSHPERPPLGWTRLRAMIEDSTIPVYAIGGLRRSDLSEAWRAGAHGIAMIRGAWT